jgi:hypothetical protein
MSFLTDEEKKQLICIWNRWKTSSIYELKATFHFEDEPMNRMIGQNPIIIPPKLHILLERNLRIIISGKDSIDEFCRTGVLRPEKHVTFLTQRYKPVEGAPPDTIWWNELGVKLELYREVQIKNEEPIVRAAWAIGPKLYQYIEEVSSRMNTIHYYTFKIRQSVVIDDLLAAPIIYKVEVEPIKNVSTIADFAHGIQHVLLNQ